MTFYLAGSYNYSDYFTWSISGGVSTSTNSSYASGYGMVSLNIRFTSSSGSISVTSSSSGSSTFYVTTYNALSAGSITSNSSQTIPNNTPPATIYCSAASGGSCSPSYSYQWQQSTDGTNWTDFSGKTGTNLSFSNGLSQTTYYRRKVTEGYSYTIGYSNTATVYVTPPLDPNSLGPSPQDIFSGQSASTINAVPLLEVTATGIIRISGSIQRIIIHFMIFPGKRA